MSNFFRYPTIFKKKDKYCIILGINHCHRGNTALMEIEESSLKNRKCKLSKEKHLDLFSFNDFGYAIHNFAVCLEKNHKFYYAIGGLNRNQYPYNDYKKRSGISLFKSNQLNGPWKKINTIININNIPKNPIIGIEKKCPEFDSNICFIYSKLLKSYLIFCRANIAKGCRGVQMIKTNNFKTFSSFNRLEIDTFKELRDNYYMFKCVEIYNKQLFFALVPYTNSGKNPTEFYIKKLISIDAIHWVDCGKYCNALMSNDRKHLDTHIAEIIIDNNRLEILLLVECTSKNAKIKRYVHDLNKCELETLTSN